MAMAKSELERRIGNVLDGLDLYELVELHNSVANDVDGYDYPIRFMDSFSDFMSFLDPWEIAATVQESGNDFHYQDGFFIAKDADANDANVPYVLQSSDNPASFIDRKRLALFLSMRPNCHYGCMELVDFYQKYNEEKKEQPEVSE